MSDPLVVVGCGMVKLDHPAPAGELYTGGFHRKCLRTARALTEDASIRILSARYGLVALDRVVDPYDLSLGDPGAVDAVELRAQAVEQGLLGVDRVVALGGTRYAYLVKAVWPHAETPLVGVGGIGHQLAELTRIERQARDPHPM